MSAPFDREPMLDMYLFETVQLLEQLESVLLECEKERCYSPGSIREIFRIMHTIKGSSAMMVFTEISKLAHNIEDLFFYFRENKPLALDFTTLSDLMLACVDFIKSEIVKITNREEADGIATHLIGQLAAHLEGIKREGGDRSNNRSQASEPVPDTPEPIAVSQTGSPSGSGSTYRAVLYFDEGCEMENIRAFAVVHNLKELAEDIRHEPDSLSQDESVDKIRSSGFTVTFRTERAAGEMQQFFESTLFLRRLEFIQLEDEEPRDEPEEPNHTRVHEPEALTRQHPIQAPAAPAKAAGEKSAAYSSQQSMISVSLRKLDLLMDLVGELVISEAMVTQNPDLKGLVLDNFQKAARQHRKITGELQDIVMSIRMVPLAQSFHKMHRIVRDMSKQLDKDVELIIIGEETEVDKNIIEHISDPLMHLIRNSLDHGVETPGERKAKGKPGRAAVTLEARNEGGEVLILVKDNGRGLNKAKILEKARKNGLLHKPEGDMTDKEIYNLIFLPGFSTKDGVSEFSGRGVGMDVVTRNIEAIGGMISMDSLPDEGTTITLKIPLTLAIVNGMTIRVGNAQYTIPTTSVKESFRAGGKDILTDPAGLEMVMVRGCCYPVLRLHQYYKVSQAVERIEDGIMVMVESGTKTACLFADVLIGEQQVVVKALPAYIKNHYKIRGVTGCTLLGDGSVSLILDIAGLIH